MPSKDILDRLVQIDNWDCIPRKCKTKKCTWIYFRCKPPRRKFTKAIFISYNPDEKTLLCRFPGSAFVKKTKGIDKIYIDPDNITCKDMKKICKGYKSPLKNDLKTKTVKKTNRKFKDSKKKPKKKMLIKF